MKTVMLVDDERPARELLKLTLDWEKAGFTIIWEARNGKQALEQYQLRRPDLIITDVQMPVMDGLELLKQIKSIAPDQKVVILSCHENFAYAKQALKYGVLDYLIKDALTEETLFNLLKGIQQADTQASETEAAVSKNPPPILHGILSQVPEDREKSLGILDSCIRRNFDYFCCSIRLEGFTGIGSEWQMLMQEILQTLESENGGDVCLYEQHSLLILCLVPHQSSKMDAFNNRFRSLRVIRTTLQDLTGCPVSMGVSDLSRLPAQLTHLIKEACQALESKVFQGTGKTLYYNPEYSLSQKFQIDTLNSHFRSIRTSIESLDAETLQKSLSEIYNKSLSGVTHYNYLNYVNAILIELLMEECTRRSIPYQEVFGSEVLPLDIFDQFNTVDKIHDWFASCFLKLFQVSGMVSMDLSPRIRKILDYIHKNFHQDISLETIADTFWLHKVYLAKIFKQETGKSVNEYIRWFRIQKAKELLIQENIKINEIVAATGFNNPQSFYTIFKRYVGMKPGEYREWKHRHT